jgi:hypothetical protein
MSKKKMVTIAGCASFGVLASGYSVGLASPCLEHVFRDPSDGLGSPYRRPVNILVSDSAMNMPIGVVVGILAIQSKCFPGTLPFG